MGSHRALAMLLPTAFISNCTFMNCSAWETELPPRQRLPYSRPSIMTLTLLLRGITKAEFWWWVPHRLRINRLHLQTASSEPHDNHKVPALFDLSGTSTPIMSPHNSFSLEAKRVLKLYFKSRKGHITKKIYNQKIFLLNLLRH